MTSKTSNQSPTTKSSLIDLPLKSTDEDLLLTNNFSEALINFIEHSDTPITIALQGEWGRGKTSVLNAVSLPLCGKTFYDTNSTELNDKYRSLLQPSYYGVFINAWHFSLDNTPEQAVLGILSSIVNQLSKLNPNSSILKNIKNALISIAKNHGSTIVKEVSTQLGAPAIVTRIIQTIANFIMHPFTKTESKDNSKIKQLKHSIELLIKETMAYDHTKTGVILFIDDLDRIDPELAVNILEILKNIFEIDHCISIIAIDYNIFVNGMKNRLGEYNSDNKHEFQLCYEKIVHLSLSMPKLFYINNFVKETVIDSGLFEENELSKTIEGENIVNELSNLIDSSVRKNPRAIKRLSNTLSFIVFYNGDRKPYNNSSNKENKKRFNADIYEKLLFFAVTCLQLAYPNVHLFMINYPNFIDWDKKIGSLNQSDEPWSSTLYQICCNDEFSKNHIDDINYILSKMKEYVKIVMKSDRAGSEDTLMTTIVQSTNIANILYKGQTYLHPEKQI